MAGITAKAFLLTFLCGLFPPTWARAQVTIEYVAHSCFRVQSPAGINVVLDPYNGHRWLGYSFPESVVAHAILITHPHYDHDASYYWPVSVPVFRTPGRYAFGDVRIEGIPGKHADPHGKEFGQINTIWVLEVGGLRIVHLGDNGPLTQANVQTLGRVDVLMVPIDSKHHILSEDEIEAIRRALKPRILIPMHYQLPALSSEPKSLGPIEPWLAEHHDTHRLTTNCVVLQQQSLPLKEEILVFQPSAAVKPWSSRYREALAEADKAKQLQGDTSPGARKEAAERLRKATELAPDAIIFWQGLGRALQTTGNTEEAIQVLERGLAGAGADDWEYTANTRALLAQLYSSTGRRDLAAQQYRLILNSTHQEALRKLAKDFRESSASLCR